MRRTIFTIIIVISLIILIGLSFLTSTLFSPNEKSRFHDSDEIFVLIAPQKQEYITGEPIYLFENDGSNIHFPEQPVTKETLAGQFTEEDTSHELIVLLTYDTAEGGQPYDQSEIQTQLFDKNLPDSLRNYLLDSTYGKHHLTGIVNDYEGVDYVPDSPRVDMYVNEELRMGFPEMTLELAQGTLEILSVENFYVSFTLITPQGSISDTLFLFEEETYNINGELYTIGVSDIQQSSSVYNRQIERSILTADDDIDFGAFSHIFVLHSGLCGEGAVTGFASPFPREYHTNDGTIELRWAIGCPFQPEDYTRIIKHEMSHTLGLNHANYLECDQERISQTCSLITQGNLYDSMGISESTFASIGRGRIEAISSSQLLSDPQRGFYTLEPLNRQTNNLKALEIPLENPYSQGDHYYVEFREKTVHDFGQITSNEQQWGPLLNGAIILLGTPYYKSAIVDMQPGQIGIQDFHDIALRVNDYFYDESNNAAIQVAYIDEFLTVYYGNKPVSIIANNEDKKITGQLEIRIDMLIEENWQEYEIVLAQQLQLSPNQQFNLDSIWNELNWSINEEGDYRIIATFTSPDKEISNHYRFSVLSS